jgi:hypothetical protein
MTNEKNTNFSRRRFLRNTLSLSAGAFLFEILSPLLPDSKKEAEATSCCYSNCYGARGRR